MRQSASLLGLNTSSAHPTAVIKITESFVVRIFIAISPLAPFPNLRHARVVVPENPFRVVQPDPGVQLPKSESFGVLPPLVGVTGEAGRRVWREGHWNKVLHPYQLQTVPTRGGSVEQRFRALGIEVPIN